MPTCLELAGVSYSSQFEGRNVIPLTGKRILSVLRGTHGDQDAQRVIAWPRAVRHRDWKLVILQHKARPELFRISQDRDEELGC